MNGKTIFHLLLIAFFCTLFSGCGRPVYLLPVRDGKGIETGAHVFWDQGGMGAAKAVGTVTDVVESGNKDKPVMVRFDLKDDYRETIRENVAGAIVLDPSVAQSAFVLLLGGTGEGKSPIRPGVAIQEVRIPSSVTDRAGAFFDWLCNARSEELVFLAVVLLFLVILFKFVGKVLKAIVALVLLGAIIYAVQSFRSDWDEQKNQLAEGVSRTFDQVSDWVSRHADELRGSFSSSVKGD